jgi:hypothetical protein
MEVKDMTVEHITDNGIGVSDMQVTLDKKSTKLLIRKGMNQVMAMMGEKVDMMPVVDTFSKDIKEYCLTDSEAQLLIQVGVLASLTSGINEHIDDPVPCNKPDAPCVNNKESI